MSRDTSARVRSLFNSLKSRCKEKRDKNNRIIRVGSELPFTLDDFRVWLTSHFGADFKGAWRCHFCRHHIGIETVSPDHGTPLKRGGSAELVNLLACCESCNQIKGKMTAPEFSQFLQFMESFNRIFPDGAAVRDIMHRLASARKAANSLNFMRAKAAKLNQPKVEEEF